MTATKIKKSSSLYVRELTTKYKTLNTERIHVSDPGKVANFIREQIGEENREHFSVLGINTKNVVVIYHNVSIGTVDQSIVHPREVFTAALLSGCSGIIVTHNHPSGIVAPSKQDIEVTRRISEAGKVMGIPLVDHIIVGFDNPEYYSMKENGYL
ncbi:MAG: DNA repair protein RadC [Spirochaetae bacterium HGW-Spirochaetae-5]|nr:MAG: DNA repair protein RadC [Spirochaetae bacterium HGW-Spirochaetae-5]